MVRIESRRRPGFTLIERGHKVDMAGEAWQLGTDTDPHLLEHPTLATCLAVLLVVSLGCTLWGAYICSRREFHVKTPESA